jgi:predicted nucleic acid-binding protein
MSVERLFLDTVFVQALLNRHDQYHHSAQALLPRVRAAAEVWVSEAILVEIGNALSIFHREAAVQFIERCYHTANMHVVSVDTPLLLRALQLYHSRLDKTWGLTDCISFVVMQDHNLALALAADRHFEQAGFQIVMPSVP